MKQGEYFLVLLMAVFCVVLTGALITMGQANMRMQVRLQEQQQKLNQGILGQQAQQLSAGVLKDMADSAASNEDMRKVIEKHGYRVQPAGGTEPGQAVTPKEKKALDAADGSEEE
jgi:hypothetical protein